MLSWRDMPTSADYARADIDAAQSHNRDLSKRLEWSEERRLLAEWKLECLEYLEESMRNSGNLERADDLKRILGMTQDDMERYRMEGWHD